VNTQTARTRPVEPPTIPLGTKADACRQLLIEARIRRTRESPAEAAEAVDREAEAGVEGAYIAMLRKAGLAP